MNTLEGRDYNIENGLFVMTATFHLRRGYCCGSGCRHCPYDAHGRPRPEHQDAFEFWQSEPADSERVYPPAPTTSKS